MMMFARNKDKTSPTESVENTQSPKQASSRRAIEEEVVEPPKKRGWFFGKAKKDEQLEEGVAIQEVAVQETNQTRQSSNREMEQEVVESKSPKNRWFFGSSKKNKSSASTSSSVDLVDTGTVTDTSVQATTTSWLSWRERGAASVETDQKTAVASNTGSSRMWGFGSGRPSSPDSTTVTGQSAATESKASTTKSNDTKNANKDKKNENPNVVMEDESVVVDCTCCGA